MSPVEKRVLIIEDETAVQMTLRTRLESLGYGVLCASDGEEGLQMAQVEKPDLVILDLNIPKRDGYSVCRSLKADPRHSAIPILMLTARVSEADRVRGLQTGADAYLTKPFDSAELVKAIRTLLQER